MTGEAGKPPATAFIHGLHELPRFGRSFGAAGTGVAAGLHKQHHSASSLCVLSVSAVDSFFS